MKRLSVILLMLVFAIWILGFGEKLLFPIKYRDSVIKYSKEFELEPELVLSVMKAESSFCKDAISRKNALGLMQLMYETANSGARELKLKNFEEKTLLDPDTNIRLGCWYMKKLNNEYKSTNAMIAAYNAGGKNVRSWFENIDYENLEFEEFAKNIKFKETKNFFLRVTNNYKKYKKIYRGNMEE